MRYEWDSGLETGYPGIDEQHRQLVEALNDLLTACKDGGHRAEVKKTVDFLVAYAVKHFADEETFQLKCEYPDYERHKRLHDEFKIVASELAGRLIEEGATVALIADVQSLIGGWLISHIKGEDLKIALHARSRA